jgi:hypothetical protein
MPLPRVTRVSVQTAAQTPTLCWDLPRYGLQLELSNGALQSLDYRGYQLSIRQQLVWPGHYTLPGLEMYLVLERSSTAGSGIGSQRSETLVLVPAGHVAVNRSVSLRSVTVQVPK